MIDIIRNTKKSMAIVLIIICLIGIALRFYHITDNQLIYYDEGLWLNNNRGFVELVSANPPQNFTDLMAILKASTQLALKSAKSLWAFLVNLRGLILDSDAVFFPRLISAICGCLTIGMTFLFAKRYYGSALIGLLSAAIVALLPSHVFYSRIAIQEALSTLLFICGLFLYISSHRHNYKTFLSGIVFSLVFFSNYRMIIIPFVLAFCEIFISLSDKRKIDFQKYIWTTLVFFATVFVVGSLYGGSNTYITFAWMFHQADLAEGHFRLLNIFSYPYYLFRLESILLALFFFGNIYFLFQRQSKKAFPFALVCLLMLIFSLPQEKGVRYLCVGMPFIAMATAVMADDLLKRAELQKTRDKGGFYFCVVICMLLMFSAQLVKCAHIVFFQSDYAKAVESIRSKDPEAKILSSQHMVQSLFVDKSEDVKPLPKSFKQAIVNYSLGYRYLIICPQAYVSYTNDGRRFSPQLKGYLHFIESNLKPIQTYPHFNPSLLERFVLEHNEDLSQSLEFLQSKNARRYKLLRIYDMSQVLALIKQRLSIDE